jgi:ribosomal protein S18 acetylase RimI-like enzyme
MIRKAVRSDASTIILYNINLAKETENMDLNPELITKGVNAILSDPSKGCYFVYEEDGEVVGQLMITLEWSDWRNANFWWIQSVYVRKDYRRRGIFQALYNHVKELILKDPAVCGLRLYVEHENKIAQETYQRLGMKESCYLLYEWKK